MVDRPRWNITPRTVLIGEETRVTRGALLIAIFLLLFGFTVDYLWMSTYVSTGETGPLYVVARVLHGPLPTSQFTWGYSAVLIIGIAAVHAYFNVGLLTSLILAVAPAIGSTMWSLDPFDTRVMFTPELAIGRVMPEVLVFALIGFLLGLGLRGARRKLDFYSTGQNPGSVR